MNKAHPLMEVHMLSALLAAVLVFGGVNVTVTGSPSAPVPMAPDAAHPEVLKASNQMSINTRVLMTDDSRWVVKRSVRNMDGSILIELRPTPTSIMVVRLTVEADSISTPIWWVGDINAPVVVPTPFPEPTPITVIPEPEETPPPFAP